jgi:hypothetical protein
MHTLWFPDPHFPSTPSTEEPEESEMHFIFLEVYSRTGRNPRPGLDIAHPQIETIMLLSTATKNINNTNRIFIIAYPTN